MQRGCDDGGGNEGGSKKMFNSVALVANTKKLKQHLDILGETRTWQGEAQRRWHEIAEPECEDDDDYDCTYAM